MYLIELAWVVACLSCIFVGFFSVALRKSVLPLMSLQGHIRMSLEIMRVASHLADVGK